MRSIIALRQVKTEAAATHARQFSFGLVRRAVRLGLKVIVRILEKRHNAGWL